MMEQVRNGRVARILISGLAVAAVAGVAIAGTAMARNGRSSTDTTVAGGGPATPSAEPSTLPTPSPTLQPSASPSAPSPSGVPSAKPPATPSEQPAATPSAPRQIGQTSGVKPVVPTPKVQEPPADPVAACKGWLKEVDGPASSAKVVARLDGAPGSVLILADSKYWAWAGCDTAYARHDGDGSIRQPAKLGTASTSADAFAVANNLIPIKGKQYEYYWAAGVLPAGITKIAYTFPDGKTTNAVIKGGYWVMQHQTATPWKEGTAPGPQIKVTLTGKNEKTFKLVWGEQTCAQISHGC
ncbi:hypothetical protein E0H73_40605 [Kribbella pittospori]|uniref:Uncharacterized protein n=1 Tax=Kribbella pittospori TaxID=722689 RepID=A0A4R0K9G5_9ACTN|nr:hypothetical protein [Kribbella pittospori]TCC51865.1 hypothetical protein E0H73_40605 [Kribbella pittospori]